MAEDLTDYLLEHGFRVRYLHSEVDTLERIQIIRDLRLGEYDVLVGVNLLREGLDLPEVSLVAILDADKEGFLRGETSLIQTIGRAARNVDGPGADVRRPRDRRDAQGDRRDRPPPRDPGRLQRASTGSRRRRCSKGISEIVRVPRDGVARAAEPAPPARAPTARRRAPRSWRRSIVELEEEMLAAAEDLRFEEAAPDPRRAQGAAPRPRGPFRVVVPPEPL